MKQLTDKVLTRSANAWGRDTNVYRQRFVIETTDVGRNRNDYGGHGQPGKTFKTSDVGREIEVMTDTGYHCWSFVN